MNNKLWRISLRPVQCDLSCDIFPFSDPLQGNVFLGLFSNIVIFIIVICSNIVISSTYSSFACHQTIFYVFISLQLTSPTSWLKLFYGARTLLWPMPLCLWCLHILSSTVLLEPILLLVLKILKLVLVLGMLNWWHKYVWHAKYIGIIAVWRNTCAT